MAREGTAEPGFFLYNLGPGRIFTHSLSNRLYTKPNLDRTSKKSLESGEKAVGTLVYRWSKRSLGHSLGLGLALEEVAV